MVEPGASARPGTLASADFDPRASVILSEQPALPPSPAASGTATVVTHQPDRLSLDVQASAQAILVVSELYYPGWRATVDGADTPIYRADHALRAVLVPAGHHSVEMVFDPLSFRAGAIISLAAIAAAAVVLLRAAWRARWR